ncbi:MAG: N-acetyl sugar amidotransferase [bacterium]
MKYCTKCVQPDSRPDIYFNEKGICGACLWEEEKKKINWGERQKELKKIAAWAKKEAKKRKTYDCVIGVSGGKDSTFQSLYARDRLGLRPLLVNGEPEGRTEIGSKNIENLKQLGFDCVALRPNPKVMKKLIKKDFYNFLNPVKVTEFSLWASAFIIADKFNIPLIIQGENAALTLGVSSKQEKTGNAFNVLQLNTLSTGWKRYLGNNVAEKDLFMFHFDLKSLIKKKTKAIWLQYYAKEWSQVGNAEFSKKHGLKIRKDSLRELGRIHKHSALDSDLNIVNQMFKYMKLGFGFATDEACYDIREGRLSRKEGFKLVKEYDGLCGEKYIKQFCDYIDITVDEFWRVAESFRNRDLFKKVNGAWKLGSDYK